MDNKADEVSSLIEIVASWVVPVITIGLFILLQLMFWSPTPGSGGIRVNGKTVEHENEARSNTRNVSSSERNKTNGIIKEISATKSLDCSNGIAGVVKEKKTEKDGKDKGSNRKKYFDLLMMPETEGTGITICNEAGKSNYATETRHITNANSKSSISTTAANTAATTTAASSSISKKTWTMVCTCEQGFLSKSGFMKSFGAAEAILRLGTGQCYHKQA